MHRCLKCQSGLGLRALVTVWLLRTSRCGVCGAQHALALPRGARLFIQGFIGVTFGLTIVVGNAAGWDFLESTSAYLFIFIVGTVVLVLPFALAGKLAVGLVDEHDGSSAH